MKSKQKSILAGMTSALLGASLGALSMGTFGYLVGKSAKHGFGMAKDINGFGIFCTIMLVFFLTLALHEAGHLLAGLKVNFKLHLFVVGPIRIERAEKGNLRLRFNRDLSSYGGMCGMLPTDDRDLLSRFAFTILGGPLMSLTVGVVSLAAGQLFSQAPAMLRLFLMLLGILSLMICLVTSIPMPNGAFLTDGARWLRLRRGGELARRDAALLQLYALTMLGRPATEWPPSAVQDAITVNDDSIFEAAGRFFAYAVALEEGSLSIARMHLDRTLEIVSTVNPALAAAYRVEAAWFLAWHENDLIGAQQVLDKAGKNPIGVSQGDLLITQAALALRQGERESGLSLLQKAETLLASGPAGNWGRQRLSAMREESDRTFVASSQDAPTSRMQPCL